jgi:microcystin-dependent protein
MQRVTHSTAASTKPPVSSTGSPGFFEEGLPGDTTPSTHVTGDWANGIQEELINVIEEGGLTPDIDDNTQLYQAILNIIQDYVSGLNFVPVGTIIFRGIDATPTGWLFCNGAAVSRSTYSALFAAIGTTFGAGDGTTTFNLPDLRAKFIRGWSSLLGSHDAGRVFGSTQAEDFLGHAHAITLTPDGGHTPAGSIGGTGTHNHTAVTSADGAHTPTGSAVNGGAHAHTINYQMVQVQPGTGTDVTDYINGGSSVSGATNANQGNHAHALSLDAIADHNHTVTISGSGSHVHTFSGTAVANHSHGPVTCASVGGAETRPYNIALYPMIKT